MSGWPFISRDGHWLVRVNRENLQVMRFSGGSWISVASGSGDQFAISPDGNWVYFDAKDSDGKQGLFRVATSGGDRERVGDFPVQGGVGSLRISPDGRKIIAAVYDSAHAFETWTLENFTSAVARQ